MLCCIDTCVISTGVYRKQKITLFVPKQISLDQFEQPVGCSPVLMLIDVVQH